jgi:hypothetical protein
MKKLFYFSVCIFLTFNALGQKTAEEYLSSVPSLSFSPCTGSNSQIEKFITDLDFVDSTIRADLQLREEESEQFQQEHQDESMQNIITKLGYSKEDAQKLKNADNMSEEELLAIANKMMENKTTMNLDDLKKVSDYDTAAQQRWMKAQSTIMMADAQADPEKTKQEQLEIKNKFDLQNEVLDLSKELRAGESKYQQQLDSLNSEAKDAKKILDERLDKARKQLEDATSESQRDQIEKYMKDLADSYCKNYTPRYLQIVEEYKHYLEIRLKDYYNLEMLQNNLTELQTGIKDPNYKPGSVPIGMVGSYIGLLNNAFQYCVHPGGFGVPTPE